MRKIALLFTLVLVAFFVGNLELLAQDPAATTAVAAPSTGFQMLKEKFIEGGWPWMTPILFVFILGLAFAIERVITLNVATVNTDKLLSKIDDRLQSNDIEGAIEVCKVTPGPAASTLLEGLRHAEKGPDAVEKAIAAFGGMQMSLLERGLVWISLFIALAPMLGFLGTVVGMVQAFDKIEAAGDISPTIVAGGIKVALLTTVFGLIVAMVLQVFYNYIVTKIDTITHKMEESSIGLIDILIKNKIFK